MEVRNTIILEDKVSPVLAGVMTSLRNIKQIASSVDAGGTTLFKTIEQEAISGINTLKQYQSELDKTKSKIGISPEEQNTMLAGGLGYNESGSLFSNMILPLTELNSFISLAGMAYDKMKDFTQTGDDLLSVQGRLRMMNNGLEDTSELEQKIMNSAMRSRASYMATSDSITKLGINAAKVFTDSTGNLNMDQLIKFSEGVNKLFSVGRATTMERSSAWLQLQQAMAAGKLQGQEMRTIQLAAPLLRNLVMRDMGVDEATFRKMQEKGEITADAIRDAVLGNLDEINEKFSQTPVLASEAFTQLENIMLQVSSSIATGFSESMVSSIYWVLENLNLVKDALLLIGIIGGVVFSKTLTTSILVALPIIWSVVTGFAMMNFVTIMVGAALAALVLWFLKFPEVFAPVVGFFNWFIHALINTGKIIFNALLAPLNTVLGVIEKLFALNGKTVDLQIYANIEDLSEKYNAGRSYARGLAYRGNDWFSGIAESTKAALGFNSTDADKDNPLNINTVDQIKGGTISLDDDSIKWISESGKREFVNRYTTLTPNFIMAVETVKETADFDAIAEKFCDMCDEQYRTSLEGE